MAWRYGWFPCVKTYMPGTTGLKNLLLTVLRSGACTAQDPGIQSLVGRRKAIDE